MAGPPPPDRLGAVTTMAKDAEAVGAALEETVAGYYLAGRLSQVVRLFDTA